MSYHQFDVGKVQLLRQIDFPVLGSAVMSIGFFFLLKKVAAIHFLFPLRFTSFAVTFVRTFLCNFLHATDGLPRNLEFSRNMPSSFP